MNTCASTPNTGPEPSSGNDGKDAAVHVAVGVITAADGRIAIARRPASAHQGGRWEFPGGKVEPGETVPAALARELQEELGIHVLAARPLLRVPHQYADKSVLLDVWRVTAFSGEAHGREGQPIRWVAPGALAAYRFPDANRPIVRAASLPETYLITGEPGLITGEPGADLSAFMARLQRRLESGTRLLQLRAHDLPGPAYEGLAEAVAVLCQPFGAQLMLNGPPALARRLGVGVHLTSRALAAMANQASRPLPADLPVAASCHSPAELQQAVALGVDFAVLGPVAKTRSHPDTSPLGLAVFSDWVRDIPLPVYALGGMSRGDLPAVQAARGQGIAGISGLWSESGPHPGQG